MTEGVFKARPKGKKKIPIKKLGKKLGKGTGVLGLLSGAIAAPTIYEIYKGSTDDEAARSEKDPYTKKPYYKDAKEYREQALKQIKNIPSALKDIFLEDPIGSTANLAWYANLPRALITEAIAPKEVASGTLDNYSPQQLKKLRKKAMLSPKVKRKKGGKIGRPKGVGCATRGYGKAMKRGK